MPYNAYIRIKALFIDEKVDGSIHEISHHLYLFILCILNNVIH